IESALGKLKEAQKEVKVEQLEAINTELQNAWQAATHDIYASQNAQGAGAPGADAGSAQNAGQSDDSNVTDVEFEEVK
ncbi:MAG: molecular chaperone DnaK, partial [Rikenellaceae bacterium]|nr:molecular chaperone DnaK [Rikenellaceae bacterium]